MSFTDDTATPATDPSTRRRKALPGKTAPADWQYVDRWIRGPQAFARFHPGQPVFVQGAGWSKAVVEAVEAGRILIRGRRAGSLTESVFSVHDSRNILERRTHSAAEIRSEQEAA